MALTLTEVLGIQAEVHNRDLILQRVTNESMITYLTARDFSHTVTLDFGLAAYEHSSLIVDDGNEKYPFGTHIHINNGGKDTRDHAVNVKQFLFDMQRFYALKGEEKPTQLQILNDLL